MNKTSDPTVEELIKNSYAALKAGNKAIAKEYASLAANKNPESEQAWLILASLSEPDQALRYLENALRANPDSQAARKGIRLTFSQLSSKTEKVEEQTKKKETEAEPQKPAIRLEDTAPIPVNKEQQAPRKDREVQEEATLAPSAPDDKVEPEAAAKATTSRKEILKKKLAGKSTAAPKKSTTAKSKLKASGSKRKKKTPSKAEAQEPVQAIKEEQKKSDAAQEIERKIDRSKTKVRATPEPLSPVEPVDEDALSNIFTTPSQPKPKEVKNQDSVWNLFSVRRSQQTPTPPSKTLGDEFIKDKSLATQQESTPEPEIKSKPKSRRKAKPKVKRGKSQKLKKAKEQKSVDVDLIEMILVSVAAILLPLLAFLYFFLTK